MESIEIKAPSWETAIWIYLEVLHTNKWDSEASHNAKEQIYELAKFMDYINENQLMSADDTKEMICNYILSNDLGDGVHYESIMQGLESNGISRGDGDTLLHELIKEEKIKETIFNNFSFNLD